MRLFVAVRPPDAALAHLCDHLDRRLGGAGAHGAPERWHLTLVFLGEQPGPAPYAAALDDAVRRHVPFPLALAGGGAFGRATWVGVTGDVAALARLQVDVAGGCMAAGAALERRSFRPHLTVGRGLPPQLLDGYAGPGWSATQVELVQSRLGPGTRHDVLSTHRLGA